MASDIGIWPATMADGNMTLKIVRLLATLSDGWQHCQMAASFADGQENCQMSGNNGRWVGTLTDG